MQETARPNESWAKNAEECYAVTTTAHWGEVLPEGSFESKEKQGRKKRRGSSEKHLHTLPYMDVELI